MLKNKDIKILVGLWVAAFVVSGAMALWILFNYDPTAVQPIPTAVSPIGSFINHPASSLANSVRVNTAWTVMIIMPFLFGPVFTLLYVCKRFSAKNNAHADDFHENLRLEIFWTIIPVFVLVAMAIPAFKVLMELERPNKDPDVVVDVVGVQFFWQYTFGKYDVTVSDDGTGTDPLVLPVNKVIMMHGTSQQVNHAWWVPAFGVKFDVIPSHINSGWFHTDREGFFKGQCAELCGSGHGNMWIHVRVVPEKEYFAWLKSKGAKFPLDEQPYIDSLLGPGASASAAPAPAELKPEPAATPATEPPPTPAAP
ncbi:hypothetical protein BH09SUM1_BH09SUM1_01330 [soil metagenome]